MIVKNEEPVLARCLRSVRPWIDHWAIVDTGSTDGTAEVVQQHLGDLPGQLLHRPWVDFATSRNESLASSRPFCDYSLVIDADDELRFPEGFRWPDLTRAGYALWFFSGPLRYQRVQLFRSAAEWRYEGVVHELPVCPGHPPVELLEQPVYLRHPNQGARSRDPAKYRKDAELLVDALQRDPGNTRTAFYLAQSYRDARMWPEAISACRARLGCEGWVGERYLTLVMLGQALREISAPAAEVRSAWLDAYQLQPERAEALVQLAQYHRVRSEWALAHLFASQAAQRPLPDDGMFVDTSCYLWRGQLEQARAALGLGNPGEAVPALRKLLHNRHLPPGQRKLVEAELQAGMEALGDIFSFDFP